MGRRGDVHEKRIEIRWRDMDAYEHVNNAVYLTYLEEVRDEWLERVLGGPEPVWHFVLARVAIDYRSQLTQGDGTVTARVRLRSVGRSSVRTAEEVMAEDGRLAAEAESVLVARDPATAAARPLTDAERALLERDLEGTA
jgi:acyl-CoA thioester hydrolase